MGAAQFDDAFFSGVCLNHQAGENAAPRSRLFPPAKRLPVYDSLSRLQCSRGLAGSAVRPDLPTATGSTSQIGAESFRAAAADSARSIRQFRWGETQPHEAQPLRRCSCHMRRLAHQPLHVLIRQMPQPLLVQCALIAPVPCCRQIRDNSFPRFPLRDPSTSRPPWQASDPRDPRCRKSAK